MLKKLSLLSALLFFPFLALYAQKRLKIIKQELVFTNPPFKECHASTLLEVKPGILLAACFGGSQEGKEDVSIWLCKINSEKISTAQIIADGVINDTLRYPTWNPVLFKSQAGKTFLFYKVGPNPRAWWGMVKTSTDDGLNWSSPQKLPDGILGPIKNKPIQLANGYILSPSSVEVTENKWRAHIELSKDDGESWQYIPIDTASEYNVIQPSILTYKNQRLQVLCRSKEGSVIQSWSEDGGLHWGSLNKTALLNPNSGTDAVTLRDGRQLIVYNPDVPGKEWFNNRGKLRIACSMDGQKWNDVAVLEDGTNEEYSYPAIIQTSDGLIHVLYTYDRKNIKHVVLQ
ncbi:MULTISPECIES: sialidase family protein [Olivibacter]|uniref:Exo-alpha-sialidase n=1 Tax=Olivibacter oleidegradans TaxID=760123 RepID=A0ABV6HN39_9SPHI|nr:MULTISPECIES: sialidase family protein [Olivibacter]QEL02804.1 sialidase [Olivibacter sp. LS-1]